MSYKYAKNIAEKSASNRVIISSDEIENYEMYFAFLLTAIGKWERYEDYISDVLTYLENIDITSDDFIDVLSRVHFGIHVDYSKS